MLPMIKGGYYIKARKIQESEISFAPPHVREIWDWLIKEANHRDIKDIKRGSTVRSLRDIQEGLKWYVGYRKEMYSKSKCEMSMNWLRNRGMITTTKTTRGMVITVCNYDEYQDPKNYETNSEEAHETNKKATMTRHYKQECKEGKECKEEYIAPLFSASFERWLKYKKERKESYKTEDSKKAAYNKLIRLAANNPAMAEKIVEQSLANNWAGLFELKEPLKPAETIPVYKKGPDR